MAIDLRQSLKLTQSLLMTPQLQQAIKLLQLSRLELQDFISDQIAENPMLEELSSEPNDDIPLAERERERTEQQVVQEQMGEASQIVDSVSKDDRKDADWESYTQYEGSGPGTGTSTTATRRQATDDESPNYENYVTKASTLQEHLLAQAGEVDFDADEVKIATVLIGNIDERGFLQIPTTEVADQLSVSAEKVEDVLDTIQRFDPSGVGARDLKECLLIQIRANRARNGIIENIIEHHLHDLETRNFNAIAKALKIPLQKVIDNAAMIVDLDPIPGRQFGGENAPYVVPDVYVFKMGHEWVVSLNEENIPKLRVAGVYKDMLNKKSQATQAEGAARTYMQDKLKSAQWLIKSIQQRQSTILKVSRSIVTRQRDFFEQGVQHLRPMILRDIAEDVEMHESTISRVTTNKFMHTPRGMFELKYFFNSSVKSADGESVASESVKRSIEDLIKAEDPKHPLSDQRIVEILSEKGVELARRTVAKYREQIGILPSSKRKKHF
jgi:RNA polymerase sigma-54 factor